MIVLCVIITWALFISVPAKGKYISPELVRSESRDAIYKRGFSSTLVA